ncbi:ATP-dependent RNA helicase DDX51-like [Watersipora subatra]|uniref:ATP-dependent RNA helicase DDX51-like n=1 Tax=Watersipora subatra TaxID=2589382 RepID=UPI00355B0B23
MNDLPTEQQTTKGSTEKPVKRNEIGGYTVLPDTAKTVVEKVRRKLPAWLESPDIVKSDIANQQKPIEEIEQLSERLSSLLRANNITHLFPVQWQVMPEVLASTVPGSLMGRLGLPPRDICCSAPTGSGKTLAFVLPIVQMLETCSSRHLRALVVLPVSDLASQVYKVFLTYTAETNLKVALMNGQNSLLAEERAITTRNKLTGEIETGIDILVSTPGRLVDHISYTKGLDLSHLRYLVLDEVDRTLEEVKHDWLDCLERAVYDKRGWPEPLTAARLNSVKLPLQKLLFSATLTENPEKLERLKLCEPRLFTSIVKESVLSETADNTQVHFAGKYTTPTGLREYYTECRVATRKPVILLYLLHSVKLRKVLVFAGSQETVHRLYKLLRQFNDELTVEEISGDMSKKKRNQVLRQFDRNNINVLVTTDIMARGIDIEDVSAVISYDAPPYIKTYIHRVGRTARAGKEGVAYTILNTSEVAFFRKMIKAAGKTVKANRVGRTEMRPYVERCQLLLKGRQDAMDTGV